MTTGSMRTLCGRKLSADEQREAIARFERVQAEGGSLSTEDRALWSVLKELRKRKADRPAPAGTPRQYVTLAAIIGEMLAIEAVQRERALTHDESERLGWLVQREQARARTRPARIARLRAELNLLEALEIAEHGLPPEAGALAHTLAMARGEDGGWSLPSAEAA